jgi:hypothetical protein
MTKLRFSQYIIHNSPAFLLFRFPRHPKQPGVHLSVSKPSTLNITNHQIGGLEIAPSP